MPLTKPMCLNFIVSLVTRKIARIIPSLPPDKLNLVKSGNLVKNEHWGFGYIIS